MIPGIHLPGREMKTEIFADFSNGLTNMNDLPDKLDEDMRACQKRMHYDTFEEGRDWVFDDSDIHYVSFAKQKCFDFVTLGAILSCGSRSVRLQATTADSDLNRVIFLADFPRPNLNWLVRWLNSQVRHVFSIVYRQKLKRAPRNNCELGSNLIHA